MDVKKMFAMKNWAVVGDVTNPVKYAPIIAERLERAGYTVYRVKPGKPEKGIYGSLAEVPGKIDVINLVINPVQGIEVVREAEKAGIKNFFIQPGAGSREITKFLEEKDLNRHDGCVLREL